MNSKSSATVFVSQHTSFGDDVGLDTTIHG